MMLIGELNYPEECRGMLALVQNSQTIYVIWTIKDDVVTLVELDRPHDGKNLNLDLQKDDIYILEPIDVVERVAEYK